MKLAAFEALAAALQKAGVRFNPRGAKPQVSRDHWETATWDGSRRAQLRRALALTVRERLQAAEALADLARRLAAMPREQMDVAEHVTREDRNVLRKLAK